MTEEEDSSFDDIIRDREKKTTAEIAEGEYWKKVEEWRSLPVLRCPHKPCKFKSVYQIAMNQHRELSHGDKQQPPI